MSDKPKTIRIPQARKELLATYANAAGSLYGVINLDEFVDVFNHYEADDSDETNRQEALLALIRYAKANPHTIEYSVFDDEFVVGHTLHPNSFDEDIEYLQSIRADQEGKLRYFPPSKEDFLKYTDASHFEPKETYDELGEYILTKNLTPYLTEEDMKYILLEVREMVQCRYGAGELFTYFNDKGCQFDSIDESNEFLRYLMDAHNNTRLYHNNGFTPNELMEKQRANMPKEPVFNMPVKVGRNEPCPCGSGKKYKKCCSLREVFGTAQLTHDERRLFYETWYKLLDYVNKRLRVVNYKFSLKLSDPHDEARLHKIREMLWENPELISDLIDDESDPYRLSDEEVALMKSWEAHHIQAEFLVMKYTPQHAILMAFEQDKEAKLFGVKGMTKSIAETIQRKLPIMLKTVLIPFKDKIVYDSFLESYPIGYKSGMTSFLDEEYAKSEQMYGIITTLG